MDTHALRWFAMVADGATVTEVAESETMSQPGVSRALARLEHDIGAPLFERRGRGLALTHAGAAFHRHVHEVLHHLDDGLAAVRQQADPESGTVALAFQPSLGTWLVPDLVGGFRRRHPRVRFDLRAKDDERVSAVGPRSSVDLELSTLEPREAVPVGSTRAASTPTPGRDGERAWRSLVDEPIRLLVPRDHRLADRGSASIADVTGDPFVSLRNTSLLRARLDELCGRAGIRIDIALVADDLSTLRGYVAAGMGVAIIPARWGAGAVEPPSPLVRYLELADPGATRGVGLSWSTTRRLLPAAEMFRDFVLRRAESGRLPLPVPVR